MLKLFKKEFWIECEDFTVRPSIPKIHEAVAGYCRENSYSWHFLGDDEVEIEGIVHEIRCVRSASCRGRYVIKCREK